MRKEYIIEGVKGFTGGSALFLAELVIWLISDWDAKSSVLKVFLAVSTAYYFLK